MAAGEGEGNRLLADLPGEAYPDPADRRATGMRFLRFSMIAGAAMALGLAAQLSPVRAQIEVRPIEVRPVTPMPTPPPVAARPSAPSLAPAAPLPTPTLTPQPLVARPALPALSTGGPPNSCRPRTAGECAAEATSCLAARGISDRYHVTSEGGATAIYRNQSDASQQQAEAAGDCAMDLQRCLAGGC